MLTCKDGLDLRFSISKTICSIWIELTYYNRKDLIKLKMDVSLQDTVTAYETLPSIRYKWYIFLDLSTYCKILFPFWSPSN